LCLQLLEQLLQLLLQLALQGYLHEGHLSLIEAAK
jgi:pantothenate synthetase